MVLHVGRACHQGHPCFSIKGPSGLKTSPGVGVGARGSADRLPVNCWGSRLTGDKGCPRTTL